VLHYAKNPSYTVVAGKTSLPEKQFTPDLEGKNAGDKPVILVSIGSGVSIIKVSAFNSFERVAGTMIGGGTLIGLSNLLTGHKDFDKIIELASRGNHKNVDMLVRDIYG
jgi:type II pantothenate kinase